MTLEGTPIAHGREADIFAAGAATVARRYRAPGDGVEREARLMTYLHRNGFPVPKVERASPAEIVMERISGQTMLRTLLTDPSGAVVLLRLLVELHGRLHLLGAPDELPGFASSDERRVLHLDLHPDNVILTPRGPVVIDWSGAKAGPAGLDLAMTWVILATGDLPGKELNDTTAEFMRRVMSRVFLGLVPRAELLAHLPAAAELRRRDPNVLAHERDRIDRVCFEVARPRRRRATAKE